MDSKMGAQTPSFFGHLASLFCARRPREPKWLPRPSLRAPKTSPSVDFHDFGLILEVRFMIFCIMWVAFYVVCLIIVLVTLLCFLVSTFS